MKKTKILYLECNSGISGDMTVGALLDLGADREKLEKLLKSLPVEGYHLHFGRTKKCGIDAFDFDVHLEDGAHSHPHGDHHPQEHHHEGHHHHHSHEHHHEHRNLKDILEIIDAMDTEKSIKGLSEKIFRIVAEAESKAHGIAVEEVHFHEVGAIDSIVDIISTAYCICDLNVDKIIVSPLAEGHGYVRCQHGVMPVPVPATANIVADWNLKMKFTENEGEMVTPTGAAIAAALHCGQSLPEYYKIKKVGIGAGNKDFKNANILRAMLIEEEEESQKPDGDSMVKLETNLDDCTGEALGFVMEELFHAGAADVWYTPIYMKKSRPAYLLSVLCKEHMRQKAEEIIFMHTTTIGIRRIKMERTVLERECKTVETKYGDARIKICKKGEKETIYPEYECVKRIAREYEVSFSEAYREIKHAGFRK